MTPGCAWITGGGSGIGRALALGLARQGWRVAISGRTPETLAATAAEAETGRIHAFPLDVTEATAVATTVARIEQQLGPLDLAILGAGDYRPMAAETFDAGLFRSLIGVNFLGAVNALDALLPGMIARRGGQIVLVGSLSAYRGLPLAAPYGASKAALLSLAESLHGELGARGVRLRIANPGFVRTRLTAGNRFRMPALIDPDEAADTILARLDGHGFEIAFPRAFAATMKLLRLLPYRLYFPLITRLTR